MVTSENAVTGGNARPGESDCEIDLPARGVHKGLTRAAPVGTIAASPPTRI